MGARIVQYYLAGGQAGGPTRRFLNQRAVAFEGKKVRSDFPALPELIDDQAIDRAPILMVGERVIAELDAAVGETAISGAGV